jgi:hypothetical protein
LWLRIDADRSDAPLVFFWPPRLTGIVTIGCAPNFDGPAECAIRSMISWCADGEY